MHLTALPLDKAIAELQTSSSTTGEVFKQLMSVLTRSNKHDVKLRCAIALSNLMTVGAFITVVLQLHSLKHLLFCRRSSANVRRCWWCLNLDDGCNIENGIRRYKDKGFGCLISHVYVFRYPTIPSPIE